MKAIFLGNDIFAVEPFLTLLGSRHEVLCVVGKPDSPAGRGRRITATPVVEEARKAGIEVFQPEPLERAALEFCESLEWDVGVVVGYGARLPGWLISMPVHGFVNVHPSLLPRYRGAAPVERAIMNGANITGVTTIRIDERFDSGGILMHREEPIYEDDDAGTLRSRLSRIGGDLLVETLDELESGELEAVPQEEDKATYARAIIPAEANIDWGRTAEEIERLVRALSPEPGAFTFFRGHRLKIWSSRMTDVPPEDEPGTLMNMGKEGFLVNTSTDCLQVVTLQPEGRAKMSAGEFSHGARLEIAERFTRSP